MDRVLEGYLVCLSLLHDLAVFTYISIFILLSR